MAPWYTKNTIFRFRKIRWTRQLLSNVNHLFITHNTCITVIYRTQIISDWKTAMPNWLKITKGKCTARNNEFIFAIVSAMSYDFQTKHDSYLECRINVKDKIKNCVTALSKRPMINKICYSNVVQNVQTKYCKSREQTAKQIVNKYIYSWKKDPKTNTISKKNTNFQQQLNLQQYIQEESAIA